MFGKLFSRKRSKEEETLALDKMSYQIGFDETSVLLDDPIPNTIEKIVNYSDKIFSILNNNYNINDNKLKIDIEYFLIHAAINFDRPRCALVSGDIKSLFDLVTNHDIALELYNNNRGFDYTFDDYWKRLYINRKELCEEAGIEFPNQLLSLRGESKMLIAFVLVFYMKEKWNINVLYGYDSTFQKVHDLFDQWQTDCRVHHYYFLCSTETFVGQFLLDNISFDEMDAELKDVIKKGTGS